MNNQKETDRQTINKLMKALRKAVKEEDNEEVHSYYDQLVLLKLSKYSPRFIDKLDKITKDIVFWWA